MSDSAYRCITGPACRCAETAETVAGKRCGAATDKADSLCPPCDTYIASAVRQLPRDWAQLRAALGERAPTEQSKIRSTPTPALPISTRKSALMAEIVETADRGAAVVSDILHTEQPTGRRTTAPQINVDGRNTAPRDGTAADHAEQAVRPAAWQSLAAAIAITEPNIDLLALAPEQSALVWSIPHRCHLHAELIDAAETALAGALNMPDLDAASQKQTRAYLRTRLKRYRLKLKLALPEEAAERLDTLNSAYHAAGVCDQCGGWCKDGQARQLVDLTGLDILLQLVDLHHQARAELGKTRLRHIYRMPCPRCGGRVGRDDGTAVCDCQDCGSSWTEREYQFLVGLITQERLDMEILKYLLAEAYSRLDSISAMLAKLEGDPSLQLVGSGELIAEAVKQRLADHLAPEKRAVGTNRKAAEQRQTTEDSWYQRNETPYQRPKPGKRRKATRPAGAPNVHLT